MNVEDINIITDPSQIIRVHPHAYIEDVSCTGFHKLLIDTIERSVNPVTNNNPSECKISIDKDGIFQFKDNGNGLNISELSIENAVTILTTKMAGEPPKTATDYSKLFFLFNFSPLLIATTSYFSLSTVYNNCQYDISCIDGCISIPLQKVSRSIDKGTRIRLMPDPKIWGQCEINVFKIMKEIESLIRELKLKITISLEK